MTWHHNTTWLAANKRATSTVDSLAGAYDAPMHRNSWTTRSGGRSLAGIASAACLLSLSVFETAGSSIARRLERSSSDFSTQTDKPAMDLALAGEMCD